MTGSEIALIIGASAALVTAIGGVIFNARRIDDLVKQLEKAKHEAIESRRSARHQADLNRSNIIILGESMSDVKADNAKMALLINQLFNQFEQATGSKPEVNIEMIKHLRTIDYITGPLGPFDVER